MNKEKIVIEIATKLKKMTPAQREKLFKDCGFVFKNKTINISNEYLNNNAYLIYNNLTENSKNPNANKINTLTKSLLDKSSDTIPSITEIKLIKNKKQRK